jgi:hypothetical protein
MVGKVEECVRESKLKKGSWGRTAGTGEFSKMIGKSEARKEV